MCFSAEASFSAATFLSVVGVASLRRAANYKLLLAAIPLLFAIQQLSEGVLWVYLGRNWPHDIFFSSAQHIFLIFAFLIWPIWIPLSLARAERTIWRRRVLFGITACGALLAMINAMYAMETSISVAIVGHSLQYEGRVPSQALIYPLIVLAPCFVSSLRYISLFGVLVAIGYAVASYFYTSAFVSVWCFFAALVSLLVYWSVGRKSSDIEEDSQVVANAPAQDE